MGLWIYRATDPETRDTHYFALLIRPRPESNVCVGGGDTPREAVRRLATHYLQTADLRWRDRPPDPDRFMWLFGNDYYADCNWDGWTVELLDDDDPELAGVPFSKYDRD